MQGVLGYVILRPLMTAVGVVAQLLGVYGDGKLRFDCVYLYTTIISNFSQVGTPMWTCIKCRPGLHALSISACLIYFDWLDLHRAICCTLVQCLRVFREAG